jgi:hypothetical protein
MGRMKPRHPTKTEQAMTNATAAAPSPTEPVPAISPEDSARTLEPGQIWMTRDPNVLLYIVAWAHHAGTPVPGAQYWCRVDDKTYRRQVFAMPISTDSDAPMGWIPQISTPEFLASPEDLLVAPETCQFPMTIMVSNLTVGELNTAFNPLVTKIPGYVPVQLLHVTPDIIRSSGNVLSPEQSVAEMKRLGPEAVEAITKYCDQFQAAHAAWKAKNP